jgi:hypothetical protein
MTSLVLEKSSWRRTAEGTVPPWTQRRPLKVVKKLLSKTILRPFRRSFLHWRVGLRRSTQSLFEQGERALSTFRWIEAPRGHFYADPMLCEHEGTVWLLVEDYRYGLEEARCFLAGEIDREGRIGPFTAVFSAEHNMSYPLVFRHEGRIYMVPETAADRAVKLYRTEHFPLGWHCEQILFPHAAYDTTPLCHEGTWYFFTTIPERGTARLVTHLFWADSLKGTWRLHPMSPIGGHGQGRGAGPIFREGGRLIRPTQCGIPRYGYSFSFDEIVRLDRDTFEQRRLTTFEPTWHPDLRGMHTYGRVRDIEVIDGCWGVNPYVVM